MLFEFKWFPGYFISLMAAKKSYISLIELDHLPPALINTLGVRKG